MADAFGAPEQLYTEWRLLLKPWLSVLRDVVVQELQIPPLPMVSDMRDLRFGLNIPDECGTDSRLLVEAIELMDLLARVDQKAGWYFLLELVGHQAMAAEYEELLFGLSEEPIIPKFLAIVMDVNLMGEEEDTVRDLMLMLVKQEKHSAQYEEVQQILLRKWTEIHGGEQFDRETHGRVKLSIEVQVDMDLEDGGPVRHLFGKLRRLAAAQADPSKIVYTSDDQAAPDFDNRKHHVEADHDYEDHESESENGEDDAADDSEEAEYDDEDGEESEEEAEEPGEGNEISDEDISDDDQKTVAKRNPRERGPIEFDSFRIPILSNSPVSNLVVRYLNSIAKTGMRLSHFTFATLDHADIAPEPISEFLGSQLVVYGDRRDDIGIQNLSIEAFKFDNDGMRALCTAIAHSHSLRVVSFAGAFSENGDTTDRDAWWPWLAYALFSKDAENCIESVSLNVDALAPSSVERIREVLEHGHPLAFLYQNPSALSGSFASDVTLHPSASIRKGHHHTGRRRMGTLTTYYADATYRVVRNRVEEEFIEFVVPGIGVCWTDRSALSRLTAAKRRARHCIRHITLSWISSSTASTQAVINLLQLIGESVEYLQIEFLYETVDCTSIASLVASCPNLKRLDIKNSTIEDFSWLEDWCTTHPMQLETLCLDCVSTESSLLWNSLFEMLGDTTHPLSRSLHQLHLSILHVSDDDGEQARVIEACLRMLDTNFLLHRVEIIHMDDSVLNPFRDRLLSHNNTLLAVEDAPLETSKKLALISALTSSQPMPSPQKRARPARPLSSSYASRDLDSDSLRRILAFAATPKRRICAVY